MFGLRSILGYIRPFLTLGLEQLARYIASRLVTDRDFQRARLVSLIADQVVVEVMSRFPGKEWSVLLEEAIRILQTAVPSMPTKNLDVITRAVKTALVNRGVAQPVL